MSSPDVDALQDAAILVVAWERGRVQDDATWRRLRDALERGGWLGFYGWPLSTAASWEWDRSG